MSQQKGIIAIDQGTTSTRAILFDENCTIVRASQQEFTQYYPSEGWVEHSPEEIFQTVLKTTREVLQFAKENNFSVAGLGITNQRETTIVWNRETGEPVYNAIVWQDRRTADYCDQLKQAGHEADVSQRTGLLLDPYFSASKINWILDNVEGARKSAENDKLVFGTIDSYLIYRLSGGIAHVTDASNASRTNLFNIQTNCWDEELLALFNVPAAMLPEVLDCAAEFGVSDAAVLGQAIPILGVAGDQHAASIGQGCFAPGAIKSTYGTGCFVLSNTGDKIVRSSNKLLSTIAYRLQGETTYALEGSIFIAGAAVQWLRDELNIIERAADTEAMASGLKGNGGVYLVPAFTGLGAPHWAPNARGAIFGLSRGTGRAELARAALESVCYQTVDLINAMASDGLSPVALKIDGGMVANDWLAQFLADIVNLPVVRAPVLETTAVGAARLAGYQAGVYASLLADDDSSVAERSFAPTMAAEDREKLVNGWQDAVKRILA